MRTILLLILFVFTVDLLVSNCANPVPPTGGPQDTIPPILLSSFPLQGTTNFKGSTFLLEFSEYINADKLTQNLIITPRTDIRYKAIVKKNQLTIKFEESFEDSTTYNLNFFDGVTDITEKTPAVNLTLAFSTGNYIDSLRISGSVQDLFTKEPSKKYIVGLYPLTDTLDFLSDTPLYFTTTNDSGKFELSYIKTGTYKILSFKDDNRNLLLDPDAEDHGFSSDTIELNESRSDIQLSTILQNVKPIQLTNHRSIGNYYEIRFNREVDRYQLVPDSIISNIVGDKKQILRLYNPGMFQYGDSIQVLLTVHDSLENVIDDTLKVVFNQSDRPASDFSFTMQYQGKELTDTPSYHLTFNKPIVTSRLSNLRYIADSTFISPVDSFSLEWNKNHTQATLLNFVNADSIYSDYETQFTRDTLALPDSLRKFSKMSPLEFLLDSASFISVERDSSEQKVIRHKRSFKEATGSLTLNLSTNSPSYTVQLLQGSKVSYQSVNDPNPTFLVKPSSYKIRILIDSNNDGVWSFGNLLKNIEPEEVFLFENDIPIRENWVYEDINISF